MLKQILEKFQTDKQFIDIFNKWCGFKVIRTQSRLSEWKKKLPSKAMIALLKKFYKVYFIEGVPVINCPYYYYMVNIDEIEIILDKKISNSPEYFNFWNWVNDQELFLIEFQILKILKKLALNGVSHLELFEKAKKEILSKSN